MLGGRRRLGALVDADAEVRTATLVAGRVLLEPGPEGAVEQFEVVAAGDEGAGERGVDLVAPAQVDRVERTQRILEAYELVKTQRGIK